MCTALSTGVLFHSSGEQVREMCWLKRWNDRQNCYYVTLSSRFSCQLSLSFTLWLPNNTRIISITLSHVHFSLFIFIFFSDLNVAFPQFDWQHENGSKWMFEVKKYTPREHEREGPVSSTQSGKLNKWSNSIIDLIRRSGENIMDCNKSPLGKVKLGKKSEMVWRDSLEMRR